MSLWISNRIRIRFSAGMLPALVLISLTLGGCATWDLRGPGFQGQTANIGRGLRSQGNGEQLWGLDERARQIERNMGI
tara:strand:+ start:631 stop:864 length:234 start_codon:yes stop_codon:yes gene_type:complete